MSAVCRLHAVLVELIPGGMPRKLKADKASAVLRRERPWCLSPQRLSPQLCPLVCLSGSTSAVVKRSARMKSLALCRRINLHD